jgi:hypothetical protein
LVLPIGKNFCRKALEHFTHVLMLFLLVLSVGPVWMFSVFGAENSRRVLSAIASETGVELPLDSVDSDWWKLLMNHNQFCNTLYMIWTKTNKGKPAKAKVMILSISIYLVNSLAMSLATALEILVDIY